MALRKIHNTYYVYFKDIDGTQRTRSLKTTDKATAEVLHRKFMLSLQAKKGELVIMRHFPERFAGQLEKVKSIAPEAEVPAGDHRRGSIAVGKMWDLALTRRKLSATHWGYWRKFVQNIGVKFADQVTPAAALAYLEKQYSKGNGKNFNNAKSCLNTIFRCCLVEAGLQQSPFEPIVNRRVTQIEHHRNLTLEEVDRIMASSVPEYVKIMVMLSRWTAQRLETCARMTPAMFDFEQKVFIIDPGKTKRFNKWVCCPIMPELEAFIRPLLAKCPADDLPIVQNFGYPVSNNAFSKGFVATLRQLGIDDSDAGKASFHSLRGTAITWFIEHGMMNDVLRFVTGHTSQAVEDVYARPIANVVKFVKMTEEMNTSGIFGVGDDV
jgi:integrase